MGIRPALAIAAVLAVGAGCGSATEAGAPPYAETLQDFKRAALAEKPYGAVKRAEGLGAAEEHVILSFCEFAKVVTENGEAWKLPRHAYVVARIRSVAYEMGGVESAAIRAAMGKLDSVVDISSLDGETVRRYAKAC